MKDAAHSRKMHTHRALQKAGQDLHGKRQPLPGILCLPAKLAKSTSRLFCDVCILAWEMLCNFVA
jgi:hypothetical protein